MAVEERPSMLWIVIPIVLVIPAYFVRKWYIARRLRVHGIGKGAPGFQTNVRRIRVTPEIAARIRRGEDVSPEEIAAASARAEEEDEKKESSPALPANSSKSEIKTSPIPVNEWLPENITAPKKRAKGKRK